MREDRLWVEKYRPHKVADTILPEHLKDAFQDIVNTGKLPNLMLTGTPGLGKTTIARAICDELGLDYIMINGSDERNIDTLRKKITQYASSVSLSGGLKVVIIDEADYLNIQSTQPALRAFIEEFSDNCRFILTCNFKNKIMEPLHSRFTIFEFNVGKKSDLAPLAGQFMQRMQYILQEEGVTGTDQLLADLIMKHAPDWRRIINECQGSSRDGVLSLDVLSKGSDEQYKQLYGFLKDKKFKDMRQWVANNIDVDAASIFRSVYNAGDKFLAPASVPQLVLIIADYQFKNAFVADKELNVVACLTEVMSRCEFI
jgi:DNA polymerase III delta prime subunit